MSEAFICELCNHPFPPQEAKSELQTEVRISSSILKVNFHVRMTEVPHADTGDLCRPCAIKAIALALKQLIVEGEKQE